MNVVLFNPRGLHRDVKDREVNVNRVFRQMWNNWNVELFGLFGVVYIGLV